MQLDPQPGVQPQAPTPADSSTITSRLNNYEKRQQELWRLTFLILLIVTFAFAWFSWDSLRTLSFRLEALPFGLVLLVILLGAYVWKKSQEIAELRGVVRGIDHRDANPSPDLAMEQLFQMISKSQQGFRDLIDSFDDVLLALSLDGEIRAANRSFADFVGQSFQEIIGRPIGQFINDENATSADELKTLMNRFVERRVWSGVIQIRLKKTGVAYFFDCVAHAMVRDDKVHGLTILARDITSQRRSEARFTELFETLQEGIYIVTPDDKILEVNPALVHMLGYDSKEDLLGKKVSEVFVDQEQRAILTREVNRQPSPQGREITLRRKDGQSIVCLNTASAVRDTSGKIVRYQGALADITERRAIELRLYQQQEFARSSSSSISIAVTLSSVPKLPRYLVTIRTR
jgi:PAS domain S-box-containing protein